ncbi:MbtH family protein [Streptomyces sp. NPDC050619]|uniref:MbtH family protein n=1 Tax=Streptomyces sp. NPDC050619 TaxID=3157214 RepID=UPI0034312DB3
MSNPFDDTEVPFHVLVNDEGQHSLWPARLPVPDGWRVVLADRDREECVTYVDTHWTDLRPLGLVRAMAADAERRNS